MPVRESLAFLNSLIAGDQLGQLARLCSPLSAAGPVPVARTPSQPLAGSLQADLGWVPLLDGELALSGSAESRAQCETRAQLMLACNRGQGNGTSCTAPGLIRRACCAAASCSLNISKGSRGWCCRLASRSESEKTGTFRICHTSIRGPACEARVRA